MFKNASLSGTLSTVKLMLKLKHSTAPMHQKSTVSIWIRSPFSVFFLFSLFFPLLLICARIICAPLLVGSFDISMHNVVVWFRWTRFHNTNDKRYKCRSGSECEFNSNSISVRSISHPLFVYFAAVVMDGGLFQNTLFGYGSNGRWFFSPAIATFQSVAEIEHTTNNDQPNYCCFTLNWHPMIAPRRNQHAQNDSANLMHLNNATWLIKIENPAKDMESETHHYQIENKSQTITIT